MRGCMCVRMFAYNIRMYTQCKHKWDYIFVSRCTCMYVHMYACAYAWKHVRLHVGHQIQTCTLARTDLYIYTNPDIFSLCLDIALEFIRLCRHKLCIHLHTLAPMYLYIQHAYAKHMQTSGLVLHCNYLPFFPPLSHSQSRIGPMPP